MFKRAWTFVSTNPGDAVTGVVVLAVAGLTLADLADKLSLSQKFLARAAIFVACALFIIVLVERQATRQRYKGQDSTQAQISSSLQKIESNLTLLQQKTQIAEVPADDIGTELKQLLVSASCWYFRGGSGRWQRSEVLPALAKIKNRDVEYVMQVLNPCDRDLCGRYASYRARQRAPTVRRHDEEKPETVRDDILACIYAAAWYRRRTRVDSKVYLSPIYSPLRLDIGTSGLMETVADPVAPGLFARRDSWYYESVLDEIKQACAELPSLTLCSNLAAFPADRKQVNARKVEQALKETEVRQAGGGNSIPLLTQWALDGLDFGHIGHLAFTVAQT